ncbi:hypothetical protein Lal_00042437 [Lupinus albus]|nr:hypothetical protein Lal_00042437 [Lupinus albus]
MVSEHMSTLQPRLKIWFTDTLISIESESECSAQSEFTPLIPPGPAEYRGLDEFCKQKPKQFQGGFALDAANEWVQSLERIFRAMSCGDVQRVKYASYMLANEAENWWEMTRRQMETQGQVIV